MYRIYKITSSPVVDYAAEELKKYLRMMMPDEGEIPIVYDPFARDGFRLGVMADFGLDTSEAADIVLDDILHIDTDDCGGIIAGSNPRSVLLAVYRYLTINGCRWLFPGIDGEYIPIKDIAPTKYHKMADCRYRGQCNEGAEFQTSMIDAIEFAPKIGMNIFMLEFFAPIYYDRYYDHPYNEANREPESITREIKVQWKRQCEVEIAKRGLQFHDIGHGWAPLGLGIDPELRLTEEEWEARPAFKEAEPYIAIVNGKKTIPEGNPWLVNFCMSNPEARKKVIQPIVNHAKKTTNVDFLHVWLSDATNMHCECAECSKKTASDWYAILLNEIDAELTKENLDTHIVMIGYKDTLFAPETVTFNNPSRFTILLAPISRSYASSVEQVPVSTLSLPKYERNKVNLPQDPNMGIAFGQAWKNKCDVDVILYEYHFWVNQVYEPTGLRFAKILHDDVCGYKYHGFDGIIQDGSQRSFFPSGLAFYTYGLTLFDNSLSFEEILEDYCSHAYGKDWREVVAFLEKMADCFDHKYLTGARSANPKIGQYYNPAMAEKFRAVKGIVEEFRPFMQVHKRMPMRAQTMSYRLLNYYLQYAVGISEFLTLRCFGLGKEAKEKFLSFYAEFGKCEAEIERWFDFYISARAWDTRVLKKEEDPIDYGV